jgi:PAS domain S-box-containing protein
MLDVIGVESETMLACNATEAAAIGYEAKAVIGEPVSRFYLRESLEQLRALAAGLAIGSVETNLRLRLRHRDGQPVTVAAHLDVAEWPKQGRVLRTVKTYLDPTLDAAEQALRENELLRGIVSTSRDALWCIEFAEPVDLTAPLPEVIRQFFENACYWRLCNRAMARFYKLPENMDFNETHVRATFPRNLENEAFARLLIEHGFDIDGAPALDRRLDGAQAHVENDVRSHIADGMLLRMWGSTRDLSEQRRKEQTLASRLDTTVEILGALPDPILVIARDGLLAAANPAVEWQFGWLVDEVLGRSATDLVRFPDGFDPAGTEGRHTAVPVTALAADGSEHRCRAHVTALGDRAQERRLVVMLRPEAADTIEGPRRVRAARASR